METNNQSGAALTPKKNVNGVVVYEDISNQVMERIHAYEKDGSLVLPPNYNPENNLKAAWLTIQDTVDRNSHSALDVCTKTSIAKSLLSMVLQGLSVSKNQAYFIVYGKELTLIRSYFGTVAVAKRVGMKGEPVANVIYDKDDFIYRIDNETGLTQIVKHEQKLENIDNAKIKGAYAIITYPDGSKQVTIMTINQIHAAWNQGATKGASPAHKNFAEEMAKRSVINRACKMLVNSSSDAYLYESTKDEEDTDAPEEKKNATVEDKAATKEVNIQDVTFEEEPKNDAPRPETHQLAEEEKKEEKKEEEQKEQLTGDPY